MKIITIDSVDCTIEMNRNIMFNYVNLKKKKKDVQLESCELSFIWGKMRTAAWEAASQIAPSDCSKAAVGEGQYIRFW